MANNSYLYANMTNDPGAPLERLRLIKQSSNEIPVLWYCLFSKDDVCSRAYFLDGGDAVSVPGLMSPTLAAASRLRRRLPALRSWLPKELHAYLEEWGVGVSSVTEPYIQLDAADAILLLGAEDLAAVHAECIGAFDGGDPEALVTLFDRVSLTFDPRQVRVVDFEPRGVEYSLVGYS